MSISTGPIFEVIIGGHRTLVGGPNEPAVRRWLATTFSADVAAEAHVTLVHDDGADGFVPVAEKALVSA